MSPKTKNPKLSTSYSMPGEALLKKQRRDKDFPRTNKSGEISLSPDLSLQEMLKGIEWK